MAHRLKWRATHTRLNELQQRIELLIQQGQIPSDFVELVTTLRKIAPRLTTPELAAFIDFLMLYLDTAPWERQAASVDVLHYLLYGTPDDPTDERGEPRSHPT